MVSCGSNDLYNRSVSLPNSGWYKDEAVRFDVKVNDTLSNYDFYVNLRNSTSYRYSNLFLFLTTKLPNGNTTRDTIEILLADNSGKWIGKGWGNIKESKVTLKKNLRFPLKGDYRFFIQQAMRVDTLKGIKDVGLELSSSEE